MDVTFERKKVSERASLEKNKHSRKTNRLTQNLKRKSYFSCFLLLLLLLIFIRTTVGVTDPNGSGYSETCTVGTGRNTRAKYVVSARAAWRNGAYVGVFIFFFRSTSFGSYNRPASPPRHEHDLQCSRRHPERAQRGGGGWRRNVINNNAQGEPRADRA